MPTAEGFNEIFEVVARSRVYREIMRHGAGDDALPDWAMPYSLIGLRDLTRIADELGVRYGQTFVDLACGLGGPGLWVAERTGASVVGVDYSSQAVAQGVRLANERGLSERARFVMADITSTGLEGSAYDAAMSIDAIQFVDASAAAAEIARILRPGGVAAITTWDAREPATATMVADYRPAFEASGLRVEAYEEPAGWRERHESQFAAVLERADELRAEIGDPAESIIDEAGRSPAMLQRLRRVLIIIQRHTEA